MSSNSIPSLKLFVEHHPYARRIIESGLSHSEAASAINSLPEAIGVGFSTNRYSVMRFRKGSQDPTLDELVEPGCEPQKPVQPRRHAIPNWNPGKEIDLGQGTGELRTRPVPATEQIDPEDERILRQSGLDPAKWEIAGYRESRWDQVTAAGEERELSAYRVSVRRRVQQRERLDEDTISAILHGYSARPRPEAPGRGVLAVPIADLQTGKPEGGGTAAIVERFGKLVAEVRQRIEDDYAGHLEALIVPVVGDLVEGCTSQGGRLANDIGVSEQLRVARRLLLHFFAVLAHLADRVLVIPGNHGEVRRDRATAARDNWDVEAVVGVADALEIAGGYEHVTFAYPAEDEMSLAVELDSGVVIGATHGHVVGSQDKFGQWLAGQALGKQPVGQADLLFAGHHHTFRMQDRGRPDAGGMPCDGRRLGLVH
jgi:predicted phosphodiesterase